MLNPHLFLISCLVISGLVFINKSEAVNNAASQECENPNGRMGRCISVYQCPAILGIIRRKWTPGYGFARQSECKNGHGLRPFVCCTSDTEFVEKSEQMKHRIIFPNEEDRVLIPPIETTPRTPEERQINQLFPKPPKCGPISVVNKIYGGDEAELGEFPWLANLEYKKANGDLVSVCAGNVINHVYVLTAAHCIKGKIEQKVGKLVSLRVGDHNTKTDIDCNSFGCIDPYQRLNVKRIIVHPNFGNDVKNIYNQHDIALVRTEKNIMFTDTVAPICLPDAIPSVPPLRTGMRLTVAGWGHNGTVTHTAEKRKVTVPYVDNSNCSLNVTKEQLCAGGEFRKDSCAGDSGGSLARLTQRGWIIVGLVSYGRGCGLETPAVYTRIKSYIQWIHNNVQQ